MGEQIDRRAVLPDPDRPPRSGLEDYRPHDLAPGLVSQGVCDPGVRMSPFQPQRDVAVDLVEMGAPADQLIDPIGCFPYHHLHDLGLAQPLARGQRVGDVVVEPVFRVEDAGNTSLRVMAVALADFILGHDQRTIVIEYPERCADTGDAATDDQHVREVMGQLARIKSNQVSARQCERKKHGQSGETSFPPCEGGQYCSARDLHIMLNNNLTCASGFLCASCMQVRILDRLAGQHFQESTVAAKPRPAISQNQLQGLKYFSILMPFLERLRNVATERDCAGNRQFFCDQYVGLLLIYFFNSIVTSVRGLQQLSEWRKSKNSWASNGFRSARSARPLAFSTPPFCTRSLPSWLSAPCRCKPAARPRRCAA